MQLHYFTLVKGWRYRLFALGQKSSLCSPLLCKLGIRESNILSSFLGLIVLLMSVLPMQGQQTKCYVSPTKPQVSAKTEWAVNQGAGTVTIRTTFAKIFVDNT